ncbi:MAG: Ppx/GppA family phosphatase [Campylobacteraceae bacterium]|nr:Ppx/GppA family phosphatase [Campylobacteraceae bacterium]
MAKITTIIDIGSNSMRMVVFKKSSRFGFHLINETKSKVKISEGCYENNGNLQDIPLQRAYNALKSFLQIAKNSKSRKILCVATSALRDAPNGKDFVKKVSKELGLNIKVIDGTKEAYYGGIAALNLLPQKSFVTVDIGGGSTEFSFVNEKKIDETISLKIGTVRMHELYFKNDDLDGAKEYILNQLKLLPSSKQDSVVGLGGSARALSRMILAADNYPLNVLHGFEYKVQDNIELFENIVKANDIKELKDLGVRKDRYDTIKEGTFIFKTILEYFQTQTVITSGVGVREGVYLTDLLRTSNHRFPGNFNVSVRSLLDRFTNDDKQTAYFGNNASKIFDTLAPLHNLDPYYKKILITASKLHQIGLSLNFYKNADHSSTFILNGLNYGFSHESRVLVATIIKFSKKSLPKQKDLEEYEQLLPTLGTVQWLSCMLSLNLALNNEFSRINFEYTLDIEDEILSIKSNEDLYIVKQAVDKIETPDELVFELK